MYSNVHILAHQDYGLFLHNQHWGHVFPFSSPLLCDWEEEFEIFQVLLILIKILQLDALQLPCPTSLFNPNQHGQHSEVMGVTVQTHEEGTKKDLNSD